MGRLPVSPVAWELMSSGCTISLKYILLAVHPVVGTAPGSTPPHSSSPHPRSGSPGARHRWSHHHTTSRSSARAFNNLTVLNCPSFSFPKMCTPAPARMGPPAPPLLRPTQPHHMPPAPAAPHLRVQQAAARGHPHARVPPPFPRGLAAARAQSGLHPGSQAAGLLARHAPMHQQLHVAPAVRVRYRRAV